MADFLLSHKFMNAQDEAGLLNAWQTLVPSDILPATYIGDAAVLLLALTFSTEKKPSQMRLSFRVTFDKSKLTILEAYRRHLESTKDELDLTVSSGIFQHIITDTSDADRCHNIGLVLEATILEENPTTALARLRWWSNKCGELSLESLTRAEQANIIASLIKSLCELWLDKQCSRDYREEQLNGATEFVSMFFAFVRPSISSSDTPEAFADVLELLDNKLQYMFWLATFALYADSRCDLKSFKIRAAELMMHHAGGSMRRMIHRFEFMMAYLKTLLHETDESLLPTILIAVLFPYGTKEDHLFNFFEQAGLPLSRIRQVVPQDFLTTQA